jgi:hypothetical protein
MTTRTRTDKKMHFRLENLEAREAPTVGIAGAWQAALAEANAQTLRGSGFQGMQHTLQISRPGSTFQGPAFHSSFAVNANGGASRAPINRMFIQTQIRRAPMSTATPNSRAAMFNRVHLQSASAARPFMGIPSAATPTMRGTPVTPSATPNNDSTSDAGTPVQSLPPNVTGSLNAIYQEYKRSTTVPVSNAPGSIVVQGSNVGVSVHGNGQGSFATFVSTLQNLGMQINASSDVTWTVAGMLPIDQLPAAAQTPQTRSITPMYKPVTFR